MTAPSSVAVVLQSRGLGVLEAIRTGLPTWGLEAFAVLTTLGDTVVLLTLAVVVYLGVDRRAGGFVVGALLLGFAVTVFLKTTFALPRPPVELRFVAQTGFGFPSGHAVGSTVGWGATAIVLDHIATARRRAVAAGIVVVVVSLSRVAIGVHYLVDVVAGIVVGLAVLLVAVRLGREEPLVLFGLTGAVAVGAAVVSAAAPESIALLGAVTGAVPAWQVVEPADRPWGVHGVTISAAVGGLAIGGLALVDPARAVVFGVAGVTATVVLLVPLARQRWVA